MHARTFETLKPCSNTFIDACILTASSRPTAVHFTYSTLKTSRMLYCVIGFSAVFAVWGDFQARMSTRHNEMVQVKRAGHRHVPARKIIAFNTLLEKNGYLTMVQMQMQNQNDSAFNATGQAAQLREALTLKDDERDRVIIEVVGGATNVQRQAIKEAYNITYERDLDHDIKDELKGDFENLVLSLMMKPHEFDAYRLHKAMAGIGTTESVLNEILSTRSAAEIHEICCVYEEKYGKELAKAIKGDTSGDYEHFLLALAKGSRERDGSLFLGKAYADAQALKEAGVSRLGTDECKLIEIFTTRNFSQLRFTFKKYKEIAGEDMSETIHDELSSDLREALRGIVDIAKDMSSYFAKKLHCAMKGAGTDEDELILVIVSRSEIDLSCIRKTYDEHYGSLTKDVSSDTKDSFQRLLLKMIDRQQ